MAGDHGVSDPVGGGRELVGDPRVDVVHVRRAVPRAQRVQVESVHHLLSYNIKKMLVTLKTKATSR